jgi:hypothetical protein
MRLRLINKTDCGSTADSFGNTCFYNCLKEELSRIRFPCEISYYDFIVLGEWSLEQRGKMVDTFEHEAHLETLAQQLGVRIQVYFELQNDTVNDEIYMEFGSQYTSRDAIRIVRLQNSAHFNVLTWSPEDEVLKAQQRQSQEDELFARRLAGLAV